MPLIQCSISILCLLQKSEMASHSTDEIPLSESESESEPENKGMKSGGSGNEKQSGDDESPEDKDEDNSKTGEEEETEASVYTEQDLTEESEYLGGTLRCLTLYIHHYT